MLLDITPKNNTKIGNIELRFLVDDLTSCLDLLVLLVLLVLLEILVFLEFLVG